MRHYEIVFLTHPDQSSQVSDMIKRYQSLINEDGGTTHRLENWGVRQLAYPIKKVHKAHYVLMNIECSASVLAEIKESFQFNDAIIRNMIVRRDHAITGQSEIAKADTNVDGQAKVV